MRSGCLNSVVSSVAAFITFAGRIRGIADGVTKALTEPESSARDPKRREAAGGAMLFFFSADVRSELTDGQKNWQKEQQIK